MAQTRRLFLTSFEVCGVYRSAFSFSNGEPLKILEQINLLTNIEGEKKDLVCCYLFTSLCALHDNLFHGVNLFHSMNLFHAVIFVSRHKYGVNYFTVT